MLRYLPTALTPLLALRIRGWQHVCPAMWLDFIFETLHLPPVHSLQGILHPSVWRVWWPLVGSSQNVMFPLPVLFRGNWVLFCITAPPTVRVGECRGGGEGGFLGWPKPRAGKRNLVKGFFRLEALTETLWAGIVPISKQLPCYGNRTDLGLQRRELNLPSLRPRRWNFYPALSLAGCEQFSSAFLFGVPGLCPP